MAKHIAAHINAFVYGRGREEEKKKRDKQSSATLPLHISLFFLLNLFHCEQSLYPR